jgi:hypothetical protein
MLMGPQEERGQVIVQLVYLDIVKALLSYVAEFEQHSMLVIVNKIHKF